MKAILCFGDSITFGGGCDGGWCGYLKKWYEALNEDSDVYNLGIGGETSSQLLERFESETRARLRSGDSPDAYTLIIAIGVNDSKYKGSVSQQNVLVQEDKFSENILSLIKKAKSFNQKVAFLGILPVDESKTLVRYNGTALTNERVTKFNRIIKDICKKEGVLFLDLNRLVSKIDYKPLLEDGIHPNAKGYRRIFTLVRAFLKKNNLLELPNENG